MGFIRMKGIEGLLYVPDENDGPKKYPCPDCYFCQWCADSRCSLCLESKKSCGRPGSPEDRPAPHSNTPEKKRRD